MGAKHTYLENREKYREQLRLANDIKAINALKRGFDRYKLHSASWQIVDLDELVRKLFKNPIYRNNGQKLEITDENSKYIIYCDNSGSYFRIGNKEIPKSNKGHFVGIDLKSVLNMTVNGKMCGTPKDVREALSHFRIKLYKNGGKK